VREALRVLEQEGIVISEAQRGARVAHVSQREALDALCLREVIETLAVREAVQRATVEDIDDLSAHIVAMREAEQAQNLPEVVELDRRFHERFLEIASSETARIAWRSIAGRIQLYQALGNSVWIQSESVAEAHQPIVDALKSRRPEVLRRAITYHIDQTRSSLENLQL
jgi:DNA-binding GntR family transcriptional regulator